MHLAKDRLDIGLATNQLQPMLKFWQTDIGLPFEHVLLIRRGLKQHRHDLLGSVLKINHFYEALPANPPSGYRELLIARDAIGSARSLRDPDGNLVTLVPPGTSGVTHIGVRLAVRDLSAHRRFYEQALQFEPIEVMDADIAYRAGNTILLLNEAPDVPGDASMEGPGYRYLTVQVFKVDEEHAKVVANEGREGLAPVTLGNVARISMVRDPDGNWIELSQRMSITGSLV